MEIDRDREFGGVLELMALGWGAGSSEAELDDALHCEDTK